MVDLSKRGNVQIGLTEADFISAAQLLKCEVAAIKAVSQIESGKSGFLPSGRPKILFEGHFFYRFLSQHGKAALAAKEFPTVCYTRWTKAHYLGGEREYDRLRVALEACKKYGVPESAALRSASWGRYQIMGDNYQKAGFDTVYSFVEGMFLGEKHHLNAFCKYLINTFLDDELRALDFARFAYGYNGAGYKKNNYDVLMRDAYLKFKKAEKSIQAPHHVENVESQQPQITEIVDISTPLSVPDFENSDDNTDTSTTVTTVTEIQPTGMHATEKAVKIEVFETVIKKFKHAKEIALAALAALGISGTSVAGLYENITTNPLLQYAILGLALISLLVVGILVIVYFSKHLDFHHSADLLTKENERHINIEQMRLRANPQMYNVELRRDV